MKLGAQALFGRKVWRNGASGRCHPDFSLGFVEEHVSQTGMIGLLVVTSETLYSRREGN